MIAITDLEKYIDKAVKQRTENLPKLRRSSSCFPSTSSTHSSLDRSRSRSTGKKLQKERSDSHHENRRRSHHGGKSHIKNGKKAPVRDVIIFLQSQAVRRSNSSSDSEIEIMSNDDNLVDEGSDLNQSFGSLSILGREKEKQRSSSSRELTSSGYKGNRHDSHQHHHKDNHKDQHRDLHHKERHRSKDKEDELFSKMEDKLAMCTYIRDQVTTRTHTSKM